MVTHHRVHIWNVLGLLLTVLVLMFVISAKASAVNPDTISFQGKVVNSDGTNVTNGTYSFVFKLYSVASGGSVLWTETDSLTVTGGVFQVNLGAGCSFFVANTCNNNTPIDFSNPNLYLGITFNSDPAGEMSPRVQLQSVPFAFNADKVGGLSANQLVQLSPSSTQTGNIDVSGTGKFGSDITVQGTGTSTFSGKLQSASYLLGSGPDLSLEPVVGGQSAVTSWWGLQLVGNKQASVDYTPTNLGAAGAYGVLIPVQQAGSVGLLLHAASGQTGDLLQIQDNSGNVLDKIDASGNLTIGGATNTITLTGTAVSASSSLAINASTTNTITIGDVSTGNIELGGGSAGGSGCTLNNATGDFDCNGTITSENSIAVGSASTAGSIVFKDGTGSGNTASIVAPVLSAPYAISLPSSGPATSQCLRTDSVVASQLVFGSCATVGQKLTQTFNTYATNQAANATTAMNYLMPTTGTAFSIALAGTAEFKATAAGSFRACTLFSSANVTGGSVSLRFRKNGANVSTTNHCTLSTANPRSNSEEVTSGSETFNAGDTIGVALVSTGLTPATLEHWATFTIEYGAGGTGATTLQDAYDNGPSITTTDARDIAFNLSNTATDSNFLVNIATGSTSKFAVQNNGVDVLSVGSNGNLVVSGTINTANISGGTLTATAVNSLNVSGTAISGSGSGLAISAGGAGQNLTLDGATLGKVQIGSISTGDIELGGGTASTGCTITNASGALDCSSTINGAAITATTFNTATISGGTLSAGTVSGGTLTGSAVNGLNVSGSAIAASAASTFTIDANGAQQVSIGGTSTGDILLGGGSAATGCTVTNASGYLTCAGALQGATVTSLGTVNATTQLQINGVNIDTAGTLSNVAYLNQAQSFTAANSFTAAGTALSVTNNASIGGTLTAGTFSGSGASLTNLDAGAITTGTLSDTRLSSNVALLNAANIFTNSNTFNAPVILTEVASSPAPIVGAGQVYTKSSDSNLYYQDTGGTEYNLSGGAGVSQFSNLFYAYDSAGNIDLTAGWTDLTLDTTVRSDSNFSHTGGSAEVTLNVAGWYEISYDLSTYITVGSNRTSSHGKIQEDTGSGYVDVPGSIAEMYNRNAPNGSNTGSATVLRQFNAGDKIKLQAEAYNGTDTVVTEADGVRLNIRRVIDNGSVTGTGAVNVGSASALAFYGSTGTAVQGTSGLYWDSANSRLGIGNPTPATALDVTGTITATLFSGSGANLTNLNASQLSSGTVPNSVVSGSYTNLTGTGALTTGSIASGFGTISTANDITTSTTVQGTTVTATGALQGNSLSINSGALAVNSSGAITASTGATITGTVSASVSLSSPLLTTAGALTINSAAGNNITIDSAGVGTATIALGGSNATAVNISRTGQTTTVNGALTVSQNATFNNSSTTGNNVALVNNIANFVGNGLSISNTGNTNGTSLAITEGTTLRTGSGLSITGASYNHAASETAALAKLSFTDATTSVVTSTTSGLTISPTINAASGAATRTINGLSVEPTFTACSAGSCAVNGVNVGNVVDGTGFTGTGLNIGTGWDTGISVASGGINVSSGNIVTSNLGIQFTGGTAPTCAVGEYKIFADTTGTQLKKCVDGVISEIQQDQIRSFVSSTSVAAVDNNTSSYWRTAAENNNSYPNITLSATDKQIFGIATIETTATSNNDSEVTGRIEVSTTSGRACNTGTQVGGQIGTFSSNNGAQKASTSSFVYSPASTAKQYFNICADTSTVGTTAKVTRLRVTLWEVDNSNADLAEVYPTNDTSLKAGDLVSIDPTLENGVKKSNSSYDSQLVGVVSTSPALVIGGKGSQGANGVPVALSGRVPVKVSLENGPIKTGDVLTASSVPGVAMKATKAGTVIGIAMADYNGGDNNAIMTFVKPGFANGSTLADVLATNNVSTADTSVTQAALTYFASQKDQLASSLNLSEITTDRLSAGLEIITPKVTTNELLTDTIAPATGTDVQLKLGADGTFKLVDANGVAQVSFDAAGNAQFAGTVTAKKITANQIEGLASFVQDATTQTDTATSSTAPTTNPGLSGAPNVIFGSVQAANLTVLAQLEAKGGLIVDKDAHFNGKTIFELLATFNGPATFNDNVNVSKQLVLSNDAGGTALIKQGQQTVDINFTNPYSQAPIVTASWILPTDSNNQVIPYTSNYNFYVTKTTVNGFQIVLDKPAEQDLSLNWAATAIKDAKISTSTAP